MSKVDELEAGSPEWVKVKILQQLCDNFLEKYGIIATSSAEYENAILVTLRRGDKEHEALIEKIKEDFPLSVVEELDKNMPMIHLRIRPKDHGGKMTLGDKLQDVIVVSKRARKR